MIDLHLTFVPMLFWLIIGHFVADYPLQGDFLAIAKDRNSDLGKLFWRHALVAHACIHAGFVALFTGSISLALCELTIHALTDFLKTEKRISLDQDQFIHIICKVWWAIFAVWLA